MRKPIYVIGVTLIGSFLFAPWLFGQEVPALVTQTTVGSTKPTVAVKDFEFGTLTKWWEGELNVGKGVADMLVDQLLETGALRIVERTQLDAVLQEQNLANSDRAADGSDALTGKVVSARYFITGSVTKFGGEQKDTGIGALGAIAGAITGRAYLGMINIKNNKAHVEISTRVIDTTTGEIVAAVRSSGQSKRKGYLLGGIAAKNNKVAGSAVIIGSSDFRETLLGEATAAAVRDAALQLAAIMARQ